HAGGGEGDLDAHGRVRGRAAAHRGRDPRGREDSAPQRQHDDPLTGGPRPRLALVAVLVAALVACGEESKTVASSIEVSSSAFSGGGAIPARYTHHYHFKVYALDVKTSLRDGASEAEFEGAIKDHVLASGELVGTFKR